MEQPAAPRPFSTSLPQPGTSARAAGVGLIALAMLSVALMAMHPTVGGHGVGEFVARAGRGIPGNTFVHGALITAVLLMATCLLWLRDALGADRPIVRAGVVALAVGSAATVAAGLVNGFIVPNLASHFVEASPAELESLTPVLALAHEASAACARLGMVGLSLAAVAWSICLLGLPGWVRAAGAVGLVCGLAPLGLHAAEHLRMNVHGYNLFLQIHAVWVTVAGVVLIRSRPGPRSQAAAKDTQA